MTPKNNRNLMTHFLGKVPVVLKLPVVWRHAMEECVGFPHEMYRFMLLHDGVKCM